MNIKFEFLSQKRVFQVPFCKILLQKNFFRLLAIFGRQDFSRTDYFEEIIVVNQNFTKRYFKDAFSAEEFEFDIRFYLRFFKICETTNFLAQKLLEAVYSKVAIKNFFQNFFQKLKLLRETREKNTQSYRGNIF